MDDADFEYEETEENPLPLHWTDGAIFVCNIVGGIVGAVSDAVNVLGKTFAIHQAYVYDRARTRSEMHESIERITRGEE